MNEYGFYDRLTEEFPSQIIVDVCQDCNYECVHCPQSQYKHSSAYSGAFLSEGLNRKMVDEVAEFGNGMTQQIRYTAAGEPFMHPRMMDMLEYAVANAKTFVSVTTNGSLLDRDKIMRLLKINIGLIDFSLDALSEETYGIIRRKGCLKTVRDNVLTSLVLRNEMNSKTRIVVSFVKQDLNISEADVFKHYWEEQGVDFVVLRMLHSAGGFFVDRKAECLGDFPCVFPWERIKLTPLGELYFCGFSWLDKRIIHDDYSKTTIKGVWSGQDYSILRSEHLNGCYSKFLVCRDCSDRYQTIWPAKTNKDVRGYGDMIKDFMGKEDGSCSN